MYDEPTPDELSSMIANISDLDMAYMLGLLTYTSADAVRWAFQEMIEDSWDQMDA